MYRWVDHTAEVELEIEAGTEEAVFAEALRALAELLGVGSGDAGVSRRALAVSAPDRAALLAAWLEELVFLAESDGFVAQRIESIELTADAIDGTVSGVVGEPRPLVKAVTYHRLSFERAADGYVASVVLDV